MLGGRVPGRRGRQATMWWEGGAPTRWGQSGHHVLGGGEGCASQARPVRPSCARGGAGCQAGKVTRQVRPPGRRGRSGHHVLGGGAPGRQGRQAGEASQAVMCWGGRVPGRQGHQAGETARPPCAGVAARKSGKAGQATMCWRGGAALR